MSARLLFVEDDHMIGESVVEVLESEAFVIDWVQDGLTAQTALMQHDYDLVLLDLGLPGQDGLQVLKWVRARKMRVPVLIATARDAVADRICGLNAGADDYVVKPYDLGELLARVRALIRRAADRPPDRYEHGSVSIDLAARVALHNGQQVVLSAREWAVLEALLSRPGAIRSRAQLEQNVFGHDDDVSSNAIEVYVHGIRKKLGSELIRNVRGVGYMVPKP
jgi:two-component system OmpR family response regulator